MHMLDKMGHLADGSVEIHPSLNAVPQFAGNRKLPGRSGLGIKDMDLLARGFLFYDVPRHTGTVVGAAELGGDH